MKQKTDTKNFINNFAMYWDGNGHHIFTNVGWSGTSNEKQNMAIRKLVDKIREVVSKETERINKIK